MKFASIITLAATLAAAPALAVTVTSTPGNGPLAAGESLVVTFDTAAAAGITNTTMGNVITAAGNQSGVRAAPAGTPANGVYQSVGNNGSSTFDFTGFTRGKGLESFSVYWGSVDTFNFLDVINSSGTVIRTIGGAQLPQNDGNQTLSATNRRVYLDFLPSELVTRIRFRSTGNAFEYDSFGAAAVPEPATWAMLIIGFGMVGFSLRQRRRIARVAA